MVNVYIRVLKPMLARARERINSEEAQEKKRAEVVTQLLSFRARTHVVWSRCWRKSRKRNVGDKNWRS